MAGATKEIKLVKVGNGLSDSANYVAHIANRQMLDYDEVVDEVLKRGALNISKPMLKMVVEHTLETMIVNTLKDGNSRRLGDYFTLGSSIQDNWNIANPEKSPPIGVMVALRSRGGQPTAKRQLHRIRAFFDTWMARHPGYRLDSMSWGRL